MTFDKAKASFRVSKNYERARAYLAAASQGKATIGPHMLFNAVGEVANWLSAPMKNCSAFMPPTRNGDNEGSEGEDDA